MFHVLISTYYDLSSTVHHFANAFLMKNALRGSDASDAVFHRSPISFHTKRFLLTRIWANDQRDGRPVEYRWRPLFNAAKYG